MVVVEPLAIKVLGVEGMFAEDDDGSLLSVDLKSDNMFERNVFVGNENPCLNFGKL